MSSILTAVIFGWPAMLLSLLMAGIGLVWKRWPWLLASTVLVIPPAWLFSGYPSIRWSAFFSADLIACLCNCCSGAEILPCLAARFSGCCCHDLAGYSGSSPITRHYVIFYQTHQVVD
jgi:hypothetical protein